VESIRIQVSRDNDARRLDEALGLYDTALRRTDSGWEISVALDSQSSALLVHLFHLLGRWLADCGLASCRVFFGERDFVLLVPQRGVTSDAEGFLLERVMQLQALLESRVVIDRATGFLAARLDVPPDDALHLLRVSARREGVALRPLAERIVAEGAVPVEVAAPCES
jgi:ANTAR domain-containing protein